MGIADITFEEELERTKRILRDPEKTLPAQFFSKTGQIVGKITRRKKPLPWLFNFAVLAVVAQLPTLFIALLLNETDQWNNLIQLGTISLRLGVLWMGYIELGLFATVLGHVCVVYVYRTMNTYIVDTIQRKEDLEDLQKVFNRVGSIPNTIYFTLAFTLFWCISFSWFLSEFINQFIGWGLFVGTIVFGLLTGPAVYLEGCYFFFITHLGNYTYTLNEASPAHSQVIYRISRIVSVLIYSIAIFIAFATVVVSFTNAVVLAILVGWIPTIVYFFASQNTIGRIVTAAKWKTLSRIQNEIRMLHNCDLTDKNVVEAIQRLMDYHERVRTTPNSTLNIRTGLNFLNQLALPLVGLLLANLDKIRQLFIP